MGLAPEHVDMIGFAATLSDVGKLALPDELLKKPGPLTDTERRALERHPLIGSEILDSLGADAVATWVRHHHERWDGAGYPGRLAGDRIPLGARILFAADAFEAMTRDQAWRPALTREEALAELARCAGTQFDPDVVAAFMAELASPVRPARGKRGRAGSAAQSGMLPCLRDGRALALRERSLERVDQHRARPARLDHVVDVAPLGGGVGVRELVLVVLDQLGAAGLGLGQPPRARGGRRC